MSGARIPQLDARLTLATQMGGNCDTCADIGADHGRLSAVLLATGQAKRVLVADVSDKALSKAKRRLHGLGLDSKAVFAVADGLAALDALHGEQVQTVYILGMGGDTISGILHRGKARLNGAALVLGAQTELAQVRSAICEIGYRIRSEAIATEGRHDYVLMRCEPARKDEPPYTEAQLLLGPVLMTERSPAWLMLLKRQQALHKHAIAAMRAAARSKDEQRLSRFERELVYIEQALQCAPSHANQP